jgi:hypothetical protein
MIRALSVCGLALSTAAFAVQEATPPATVVLVVGAEGTPEYGAQFATWAERWEAAATRGTAQTLRVGPGAPGAEGTDRERLRKLLGGLDPAAEAAPLWFVFLGHGTFDGERAKLNLRGPDVSARELSQWLDPIQRPTAVIVCAASSGPFVNRLSRAGRIVVTAAKSGQEVSFAHFGEHFSSALANPAADLDQDEQVSLLEAFLFASAGVKEFYESQARLANEHALLDDNGDGLGTPATWFQGVRSTKRAQGDRLADGVRANQLHLVPSDRERTMPAALRAERDALEVRLEELRGRKQTLRKSEYYDRLEELCLQLARLYQQLED